MKLLRWVIPLLTPTLAMAQVGEPAPSPSAPNFSVRRAPGPITIDGHLNDPGWEGAEPISIRYEIAPGYNTPAKVGGTCRVSYDTDALYVGCHALDTDPKAIRASIVDRDNLTRMVLDDLIGFYLDPFNDRRRSYIFLANPLGSQADGIKISSSGHEDYSFDAIWSSAGRIVDDGYMVEFGIPFKSLRFPRTTDVQTWGFVFLRAWPREHRYRMMASPFDRNNSCEICQASKVTGFQGIAPGRNIELAPTLTGQRSDFRATFPAGPLETGDVKTRLGGDVRWGVTPNVTLNATVRPDFSQIEADAAQLDVNTRFALFVPEKRPFFLEGADYFGTPIQAVFTRTVADPDAGLKLTGKVGGSTRNTVGFFAARDRLTNLLFPSNQGSGATTLEDDAWTTVARFKRDLGHTSHIGLLYSGRFGTRYDNQVGGADLYYQLGRSTRFNVQYLVSSTEYPDSLARAHGQKVGRFTGGAINASMSYGTNRWRAGASYVELAPDFRADVGFIPRVDTRTISVNAAKVWYSTNRWLSYLSIGPFGSETRDHRGELTDRNIGVQLSYQGPAQSSFYGEVTNRRERFQGILYPQTRAHASLDVKPGAGLALTGSWTAGDAIDFVNGRAAKELTLQSSAQVAVTRRLSIELGEAYQRLKANGARLLSANIVQAKVAYNFDVRTLARIIVQHRDVDRNPALNPASLNASETGLLGQFLFSYKVNPQTVLFLGYAENSLGNQSYDMTRLGRTFFAKVGYAWRP